MINLYEIMANAQNGEAIQALARQYRLSPEQANAAVEAVLPAFSMGFKQMAATHQGFADLFGMMGQQNYQAMFDDPKAAFGRQGRDAGNEALAAMFGSKDMSRAVAEQAAQYAGIGTDVMKQMLPAIIAMLIGGMFKSASQGQGPFGNILGQILGQLTGGAAVPGGNVGADPNAGRTGFPSGMPSGMPSGAPAGMPQGGDIFGGMLGQILGGLLGGAAAPRQTRAQDEEDEPAPARRSSTRARARDEDDEPAPTRRSTRTAADDDDNPLSNLSKQLEANGRTGQELFGQMLESGRDVQQAHLDNMQQVFDAFFGGKGQRR